MKQEIRDILSEIYKITLDLVQKIPAEEIQELLREIVERLDKLEEK